MFPAIKNLQLYAEPLIFLQWKAVMARFLNPISHTAKISVSENSEVNTLDSYGRQI